MLKILLVMWLGACLIDTTSDLFAKEPSQINLSPVPYGPARLVGRYGFSFEWFVSDVQYIPSLERIGVTLSSSAEPILFWNAKDQTCLRFAPPTNRSFSGVLSVSADGRRLAANVDNEVCILDAETGTILKTILLPKPIVSTLTLALSSDGSKLLAMCSLSDFTRRQLLLFDCESAKLLAEKAFDKINSFTLLFGFNDSTALFDDIDFSGSRNYGSSVVCWNFQTDVVTTLKDTARKCSVSCFQALSENKVATVFRYVVNRQSTEISYVVWDLTNGDELVRIPLNHRTEIVKISGDGRRVISFDDGIAIVTDLNATSTAIQNAYQFDVPWPRNFQKVRLSASGENLLLALSSGTTQHWKLPPIDSTIDFAADAQQPANEPVPPLTLNVPLNAKYRRVDLTDGLISLAAMFDDETMIAVKTQGDLAIHRLKTGEIVAEDRTSERKQYGIDNQLAVCADGQSFLLSRRKLQAVGERSEFVSECGFWDRAPLRQKALLPGVTHSISALATSLDGKWAAAGGDNQDIIVWDLTTCTEHLRVAQTSGSDHLGCFALEFSADGQYLIAATKKGLTQWSLQDKSLVRQPGYHSQGILRRRPQSSDDLLCTMKTGLMIRSLPELTPTSWTYEIHVNRVAFSNDGNRLAIDGFNGIAVLDLRKSKTLLRRPKSTSGPLMLSADGSTLLLGIGGHLILIPVEE